MAKTIGCILAPTIEDRWKVFRSVHPYPSSLPSISHESGVTLGRMYNVLAQLEEVGLVEICGESPLLWRLTDAA